MPLLDVMESLISEEGLPEERIPDSNPAKTVDQRYLSFVDSCNENIDNGDHVNDDDDDDDEYTQDLEYVLFTTDSKI